MRQISCFSINVQENVAVGNPAKATPARALEKELGGDLVFLVQNVRIYA